MAFPSSTQAFESNIDEPRYVDPHNIYPADLLIDDEIECEHYGYNQSGPGNLDYSQLSGTEHDHGFVRSGRKCMFHWIACPFRSSDFEEWMDHVNQHFPAPHSSPGSADQLQARNRRDYRNMPNVWVCGLQCSFEVSSDDHTNLWEEKVIHIFGHLMEGYSVEQIPEKHDWMRYYADMGLCQELDVLSFPQYGPPAGPYIHPVEQFSKPPHCDPVNRPINMSGRPRGKFSLSALKPGFGANNEEGQHVTGSAIARSEVQEIYKGDHSEAVIPVSQGFTPAATENNLPGGELGQIQQGISALRTDDIPKGKIIDTSGSEDFDEMSEVEWSESESDDVSKSSENGDNLIGKHLSKGNMSGEKGGNQEKSKTTNGSIPCSNDQERSPDSPSIRLGGSGLLNPQQSQNQMRDPQPDATKAKLPGVDANSREIVKGKNNLFGEVLLQETATKIKAYAVERAIEITRQRFFYYLLRYASSTTCGEGSPGGAAGSGSSGNSRATESVQPAIASRKLLDKGKGRAYQNEGNNGDDEDADGDGNRKKRPRIDKASPSIPPVRYSCIFFANAADLRKNNLLSLDLTKWSMECYRSGFETIARLKSHLYSHHCYGCQKCHRILPSADAFYKHHRKGCEETPGDPPLCLSDDQMERFKSKKPITGIDTEEKRWVWMYKIVFPDQDSVPSPYWQAISLECNRQHIDSFPQRNELFGLLKDQFEAALDMRELSDPLVKALLGILKDVWAKVVDSVMEKYPMSQEPGDIDTASWKAIFGDIAEPLAPIDSNGDAVGDASDSTDEPVDLFFEEVGLQGIFDSTIPASLSGLGKTPLEDLSVDVRNWKYHPRTGELLDGMQFSVEGMMSIDDITMPWSEQPRSSTEVL
ncbi:hypothetical protein ABW19_dt0205934 [Dactylella cylindrospora]|nr:hypothetical protein ABW19_dt0205934 [Dactylella cylindrospora]